MRLTVESRTHRAAVELPSTEREVSVHGLLLPLDMLDGATVRLDQADASQGVPMTVCVSNPSEVVQKETL